ncbi:hypothetical protein BKA56DRAFT_737175 [Ilyonectria sp. MPI-CAGE-AT-0026]|nr:hypothetical protein BKA56DRAFT_737175 [Ilyonectria sp. MPI-CAGE-AT-0026]
MMAGPNRRSNLNRRGSDFYHHDRHDPRERRDSRDDRDRPYSDRTPIQNRGSPTNTYPRRGSDYRNDPGRPRDRDRDRGIPPIPPREPSYRSPPMGTPTKPVKASRQAPGIQNTPQADADAPPTARDASINSLTNLICEKVSWMQKREEAEKRLAKLRADHARSGIKQVDFPSVTDMFQDQIKTAANDLATCNKSIRTVDKKLQFQFGHLSTDQILSSLAGQVEPTSSESTRRDSTRSEPTNSQLPDLEKRPMQLETSTSESLNFQLDNKLNELKRKFENDLQELKSQFEVTGNAKKRLESENQALRKSHDEMTEKLQQLEGNFDQFERKTDGGVAAVNLRVTAMYERVNRQLADMTAEHQTKSEHRPESKHQPESEPIVSDAQFNEAIEQQNDKIDAVYSRIGSALMSIAEFKEELPSQLEELRESSLKLAKKIPDISGLNSSVSDHGKRISNQTTTLDTLTAQISSLQSLVSENRLDKIKQLLDDVSAIQKRLDEDNASADRNPITEEKVYEMLKTELANAVEKLSDPNPMTEEKVREILRPELADAVDKLPQQHTASTESYGMTEEKVREILRPELANVVESLLKQDTGGAGPNAMTEDKVREILKPELVSAENKLQEIFGERLSVIADRLGEFLDRERQTRMETDGKVSTLADSISSLQKAVDEAKASTDNASSFRKAVDEVKTDQEAWKHYVKYQIHEHGREVEGHRNTLSTLNNQVEELRNELRRGYEGHQMQLVHLSSWMNTFNTRRMYNEIARHINATIPTGASLSSQMRVLSDRMDTLENREDRNDEGGVKKRKALNGNAVVISNSR